MNEELIQQISLWVAGAVAALWGGSKVPWKAWIAKLLGVLKKPATDGVVRTPVSIDASGDVHAAIFVLRSNAPDAEFQKLVTAVEDAFWASRAAK